jgi:hypothetical protein
MEEEHMTCNTLEFCLHSIVLNRYIRSYLTAVILVQAWLCCTGHRLVHGLRMHFLLSCLHFPSIHQLATRK